MEDVLYQLIFDPYKNIIEKFRCEAISTEIDRGFYSHPNGHQKKVHANQLGERTYVINSDTGELLKYMVWETESGLKGAIPMLKLNAHDDFSKQLEDLEKRKEIIENVIKLTNTPPTIWEQ